MLDSDCQVLRCTWQNISDVNVVEITPDMNIDEAETSVNNAIIAEDDTIIFLGHGTEYGLLFPDFYKGLYILHDENVNLIHAKNIICCWCHASSFVNRHNEQLHNILKVRREFKSKSYKLKKIDKTRIQLDVKQKKNLSTTPNSRPIPKKYILAKDIKDSLKCIDKINLSNKKPTPINSFRYVIK